MKNRLNALSHTLLIAGLLCFLTASCQLFTSSEEFEKWDPGPEPPPPPVNMTLELSKNPISQNEELGFTMFLLNTTQDTIVLWLNFHELAEGYYYDFNVARFDSTGVWDRIGNIIIQTVEPLVLEPGEIHTFTHEWDITYDMTYSFSETKVIPGHYLVWGNLYGSFPFPPKDNEPHRTSIRTPFDTLIIKK